jgi:methionyl-tRNA formyltransferase
METLEDFKALVFAFGYVGHEIVDFVVSNHPNYLAKVIVDQEKEPDAIRKLRIRIGSNAVMSWQEAQSKNGVDGLQHIAAEVAILAWWPHILRLPLLDNVARKAILNLHPGLLPHCRGRDPSFWSIVERRPFGVTIHHVSEDIDASDIAFQEEIAVEWVDTAETLYRKAEVAMLRLFKNNFARISRCDICKTWRLAAFTCDGS